MDSWWTVFATTFALVFFAELGDKTQLAALGLASSSARPWAVFWGSALALVLASALAVGVGKLLAARLDPRWLHYGGAALFIILGGLMLWRGPEAPAAEEAPTASEAPPAPASGATASPDSGR